MVTSEVIYNGQWIDFGKAPHICATSDGDFRIRSKTNEPHFVSVFVIPKNGFVVPIFPWIDADCVQRIDCPKQAECIIHSSIIDTALRDRGISSEGQFAIVILYGREECPKLHLLETEIDQISQTQDLRTPIFDVLVGSTVIRSITLDINVGVWEGIDSNRKLLSCYQKIGRRIKDNCDEVSIVLFGTLEPSYQHGFRDQERKEFRAALRNSLELSRQGNLSGAWADVNRSLELGKFLFSSELYPEGHAELATAFVQRGNVAFLRGDGIHALEDYAQAEAIATSLRKLAPTFRTLFSELTCNVNKAACYTDAGAVERANTELNAAIETAERLVSTGFHQADVLDCQASLLITKSTLFAEFLDRDEDALKCIDSVSEIVKRLSEYDEHRALRIKLVILNQKGMICLKRSEMAAAASYFEDALKTAEQLGDTLRPEDVPSKSMSALNWIFLQQRNLVKARETAQRYLNLAHRFEGFDPAASLDALFSICAPNEYSAEIIFGDSLISDIEMRISRDLSKLDFRFATSMDVALDAAGFLSNRSPDVALQIARRIESTCRIAARNRDANTDLSYLARALLLQASIVIREGNVPQAHLLGNEARQLTRAFLEDGTRDILSVSLLLRLAKLYNALGRSDDASKLITTAFECYPNWMREAPAADQLDVMLDHAYRRWRTGRQSEWSLDEILYQRQDYGILLHAAGDEIEGVDWCRRERVTAAMLIEGVQQGMVNPESCYGFCATRKGLATMGMRLRRASENDEAGAQLQAEIILEKQRLAAGAIHYLFVGDAIVYRPENLKKMPLAWTLQINQRARNEARKWTTGGSQISRYLKPNEVVVDFFLVPSLREQNGVFLKSEEIYYAFLLRRDETVEMIRLGDAPKIQSLVQSWYESICKGADGIETSRQLRKFIWEPIEQRLAADQRHIFVCPDLGLIGLPWSALPGREQGSVLLDDYSLAVIPYGQYLYDQRQPEHQPAANADRWLLVGDIDYDSPTQQSDEEKNSKRQPPRVPWSPVTFSELELREIGRVLADRAVNRLTGSNASTARVMEEMRSANWIHFTTHSYYANPDVVAAKDPKDLEWLLRRPLLLSGIVLAGANCGQQLDENGFPQDDGGILSGEVIKDLPLDHVKMVVLSSCDSGIGAPNESDGTAGLQRAFHLAGARNVVATLWPVDDRTTAALMKLYYYNCFEKQLDPIEALRQAQLSVRRQPEKVVELIELRGPDFTKAAQKLDAGARAADRDPAHLRSWAGFVFSGTGE
jgi:CHAT domain-containing protein/tetratricopeptide (TPR) repeat protein